MIIKLNSFVNNFTASAKGWNNPINPTLFGPLRIWTKPKIFRSNKVIKATLIKTIIINITFKIKKEIISKNYLYKKLNFFALICHTNFPKFDTPKK